MGYYSGLINFIKMISNSCDKIQKKGGCSKKSCQHYDICTGDIWEELKDDLSRLGYKEKDINEVTGVE